MWVLETPVVHRREPLLTRSGLVRDGRTCSPSMPRTGAKAATAPTSASASATKKAALVAAMT